MLQFKDFVVEKKKYKSQMSKKDKYKVSKDYLMLKTQQSKLGKIPSRYKERKGLEGPFMTKSGQVVYYDKKFGQYYNSDTDIYIDYETWKKMSEGADAYEAELRAVRAFWYFHLVDMYGNVPLSTDFTETEAKSNSSRTEVYNFIKIIEFKMDPRKPKLPSLSEQANPLVKASVSAPEDV